MRADTEASTQTQSVDELFKKVLDRQDEFFSEITVFWETQYDKMKDLDKVRYGEPKEFMEGIEEYSQKAMDIDVEIIKVVSSLSYCDACSCYEHFSFLSEKDD